MPSRRSDERTIDPSETGDALLKLEPSSHFASPAESFSSERPRMVRLVRPGKMASTFSVVGDGRRTESWDKESREAAALPTGSSLLKRSGDRSEWAESSETLLRKSAGRSAGDSWSGGWKVTEGSAVWLWVTSANS